MLDKLSNTELDELFQEYYKAIRNTTKRFPQDTLLRFYSYYKLATDENQMRVQHLPENGEELINAFKANAMFQVQKIDSRQAKINYIKLAQEELDELD
jgi:acyl-CoA-binding protein